MFFYIRTRSFLGYLFASSLGLEQQVGGRVVFIRNQLKTGHDAFVAVGVVGRAVRRGVEGISDRRSDVRLRVNDAGPLRRRPDVAAAVRHHLRHQRADHARRYTAAQSFVVLHPISHRCTAYAQKRI